MTRPEWLTDERLAELRAMGELIDKNRPTPCGCCAEEAHGCACSYEAIAIARFAEQNQPLTDVT
jgi:hypothetical protein